MQIILLEDVKKVGQRGTVVVVADGYAMNVLIPKKLAAPATPANVQRVEKEALAVKGKREMDSVLAQKALERIDDKQFVLAVKTNPAGGLFEAVREKQIAEAVLKSTGISLPESAFQLAEPIKKTGSYKVPVRVHSSNAEIILEIRSA